MKKVGKNVVELQGWISVSQKGSFHSSLAIFIKYSLSILKSLHPSSDDKSEAPRLL